MTIWNSLRLTFISALHHPRLWLLQFLGTSVILVIAAFWLHIPDSYWWQLLSQFVIVFLLIMGALVLEGGTLNFYRDEVEDPKTSLAAAFKKAARLRHLIAFALWAAIFYLVLHFVDKLDDYQYEFPGYLRSEFPAWLRRFMTENAVGNLYEGLVGFLRWVVVPGLLLPVGLLCANIGLRGFTKFRSWGRSLGSVAYWIGLLLAALIGVYCTDKILDWRLQPNGPAVTKEGIWLAFRLLLVSLLALFSWFWVCALLARSCFRPDPSATPQKVAA